jgi:hypothetical protein
MKSHFNRTWLLISLAIIGNIIVFSFLSKKLESYMINDITQRNEMELNFVNGLPPTL